MSEDKKNVTHEVTRGGITLLTSCMAQPGWSKKPAELYAAGGLLEELDDLFGGDKQPQALTGDSVDPLILKDTEAKIKEWMNKKVELKLSEKQRDAAKAALNHFVSQGQIAPTKHFCVLGTALGIE